MTSRTVTTTAAGLILRNFPEVHPSTDTGLRLRPGETASAVGQTFDGTWFFIRTASGSGWAAASYLSEPKKQAAGWRLAKSLDVLRRQVDATAPQRKRTYDGTVGDRAHAARKSDHNPNDDGVVTALDLTHDPAGGCDCTALAAALVQSRDPRIKYLIFRGRIVSSAKQPWAWRPYTGANAHLSHLHISVDPDPALYDDAKPWRIGL